MDGVAVAAGVGTTLVAFLLLMLWLRQGEARSAQPERGSALEVHSRAVAIESTHPLERIQTDDSVAWLLAVLPLLVPAALAGAYLSKVDVHPGFVLISTLLVMLVLVAMDERMLRRRGVKVHVSWVLVLLIGYFIERAQKTAQTYVLAVASVLATILGFTASVAIDRTLGPLRFSPSGLEVQLAQELNLMPGEVDCAAGSAVWVKDTFECLTVDSRIIAVTILDHDGRYQWQERK